MKRTAVNQNSNKKPSHFVKVFCDPAGTRTQDPNIKSVVLYQLSYGIPRLLNSLPIVFGSAKIRQIHFVPNFYKKCFIHFS